jgi:hypothetical protein
MLVVRFNDSVIGHGRRRRRCRLVISTQTLVMSIDVIISKHHMITNGGHVICKTLTLSRVEQNKHSMLVFAKNEN